MGWLCPAAIGFGRGDVLPSKAINSRVCCDALVMVRPFARIAADAGDGKFLRLCCDRTMMQVKKRPAAIFRQDPPSAYARA
jgi:hypothetical protein